MIRAENLRELNKVLAITADLTVSADSPTESAVGVACQQTVLAGGYVDHADNLDATIRLGLVLKQRDGRLRLSDIGDMFLSLNPDRLYELQPEQTNLLDRLLFSNGPLSHPAGSVMSAAQLDRATGEVLISHAAVKRFDEVSRECFNAMLVLGTFVAAGEGVWKLRADRLDHAIRGRRRALAETELEEILRAQSEFGRAAEVLVVEYEKERLRALGAVSEAALVRRISDADVGAGYDIESFEGESPDPTADRFIEVKASYRKALRFFWSRNEYRVAKQLGDRYCIYFAGGFRPQAGLGQLNPRIIRNPAQALAAAPEIVLEPESYLVTERRPDADGTLEAKALHPSFI